MKIIKAEFEHLIEIEDLMEKAFKRFNLERYYQKYNKKSVLQNLVNFISSPIFRNLLCIDDDNNIIGCAIYFISPQVYDSSIRQIQDLTIQVDYDLPKIKQSKVLISLINAMEEIAIEEEINNVLINLFPEYDISNFLKKKNYINSDISYIKKIF